MSAVAFLELVLVLTAAALALSAVAGKLALPPAAALVVGGAALALAPGAPSLRLDPDLILVLFLPPLLMAAAFGTVWRDFVGQIRPILLLSVGAVAFTTFVVGWAAHLAAPALPLAACFALGAIVSPPDAVAAKAVLERLSLPRRLRTILEGESLVNDASGLVLYRFAVAAMMTGAFDAGQAALSFGWLTVGGVGLGVAAGLLTDLLFRRLADTHMIVVASFLAAYASYVGAERLHASGVLAVVACGLVLSGRQHATLGAQARITARAVWAVVVFVMEALVFVLIGLSLHGVLARLGGDMTTLLAAVPLVAAVTGATVLSRFAWIFPAAYLSARLGPHGATPAAGALAVAAWAGMRGVVSVAAALALPEAFPGRDLILLAAFGVIVSTLLVQGVTLGPLIGWLGLSGGEEAQAGDISEAEVRAAVTRASLAHVEAITAAEDGRLLHPILVDDYRVRSRAVERLRDEGASLESEVKAHFAVAVDAVAAGRAELIALHRQGRVHASVVQRLEAELDLEELRLTHLAATRL